MSKISYPSNFLLRLLGGAAFVLVLILGFVGYLTPSMRLSWESVATMCGF